jgi:hypothetical protein
MQMPAGMQFILKLKPAADCIVQCIRTAQLPLWQTALGWQPARTTVSMAARPYLGENGDCKEQVQQAEARQEEAHHGARAERCAGGSEGGMNSGYRIGQRQH